MEAAYRLGSGRTSSRSRWPALLLAILVITALLLGLSAGVVLARSNTEVVSPRITPGQPPLDSEPVRVFVATQPDGSVTCSSQATKEVVVRQWSGTALNEITCSKGSGAGTVGIGGF